MARRTHIVLIDDFDGSEASETVTFGLDGVNYEIDLNTDNAEKLREAVAPWVNAGRRIGGRANRRGTRFPGRGEDTGAIRAWARENGYTVSERGRVAADIREAYAKAHS